MPKIEHPSRRYLLKGALAAGGIGIGAQFATRTLAQGLPPTPACHDHDVPTKPDIEGPFFKPRSPERTNLVVPGTKAQLYRLEGFVLTRSCKPIAGAILDLWHADEKGDYDDAGFRYRGHQFVGADGRYRFDTIKAGLYPDRTRHFHFKVARPYDPPLTTQLYFPLEPRNETDDYYSPRLLMNISPPSPDGITVARFDFILDYA